MSDDLGYTVKKQREEIVLREIQQAFMESERLENAIKKIELEKIEQLQETINPPDVIKEDVHFEPEPVNVEFQNTHVVPQTSIQKQIFSRRFIDEAIPLDLPITTTLYPMNSSFLKNLSVENFGDTVLDTTNDVFSEVKKEIMEYIKALNKAEQEISGSVRDIDRTYQSTSSILDDDASVNDLENLISEKEHLSRIYANVQEEKERLKMVVEGVMTDITSSKKIDTIIKSLRSVSDTLSSIQNYTEKIRTSKTSEDNQTQLLSMLKGQTDDIFDQSSFIQDIISDVNAMSQEFDFTQLTKDISDMRSTISSTFKMPDIPIDERDQQSISQGIEKVVSEVQAFIKNQRVYNKKLKQIIENINEYSGMETVGTFEEIDPENIFRVDTSSDDPTKVTNQFREIQDTGDRSVDDSRTVDFTPLFYQGRVIPEGTIIRIDEMINKMAGRR